MNVDDITETLDGVRRQAKVHIMQVDKWIGDWCSCASQICQFKSYMSYHILYSRRCSYKNLQL